LFAARAAHSVADVEKWRLEELAVAQNANDTGLLNDEDPPAAVAGVRDEQRLVQACGDRLQVQRDLVQG